MMMKSKEEVKKIKKEYPPGTVIQLIRMDDPTPVPQGTIGTVTGVDDAGNIHCRWWNYRSSLAIVPSKDQFEIISSDDILKKILEKMDRKIYGY